MPRGGRFRSTPIALLGSPAYRDLTPPAKLVLHHLRQGPSSNFAGLFRAYVEVLADETKLDTVEVEHALRELEQRPTRATSFIVRDKLGIVWVRHLIRDDPAREGDPQIENETQRKGILTIVGALPKQSEAVKQFRRYYHYLFVQAPTKGAKRRGQAGASPEGQGGTDTNTNTKKKKKADTDTKKATSQKSEPVALATKPIDQSPNGHGGPDARRPNPDASGIDEAFETAVWGRPLTLLQRKGREPLPPRLDGKPN